MKKEEKTELTRERIMNAALIEFGNKGYEATTLNSICHNHNIAKGLLYHNYKGKDDIYLTCVKLCLDNLIVYINENINKQDMMKSYFVARFNFFYMNPLFKRIFNDAISYPPAHLKEDIKRIKLDFDALNTSILYEIFESLDLREDITKEEVIETFKQYQDYINSKRNDENIDIEEHEKRSYRALNVMLYGVIKR